MRSILSVDPRLDLDGVLAFLRVRAIPGIEEVGEHDYRRSLVIDGEPIVAAIEIGSAEAGSARHVVVTTSSDDAARHAEVEHRVRPLLDLDAPADEIDAALSRHPAVAERVALRPGMRIPGTLDAPEMLVRAIVGQQISVVAAQRHLREIAISGSALPARLAATTDGAITRLFPTPRELLDGGADLLRGPESRRTTLRGAAAALDSGELALSLDAPAEPARLREQLIGLRGIGPWTADYLVLRIHGSPDIALPGDSAVRLGMRRLGETESDPAAVVRFAEQFRPWRSYLMLHLWARAAEG
ncbi:DNA-3-methyladenine glycosylase [Schumannella sp. 10F1B-5-1]|uniref:DNA-3-methyladenine glycosylase family protein n=1 Tax=Schumannella sp. 10F1B-5-1 TaxID=2590780 RepID=UPI0015E868F4|nr:DNA-3-methyladenine glycosylase 2 family protein [Schumannella sp. 10F1B-5-1]